MKKLLTVLILSTLMFACGDGTEETIPVPQGCEDNYEITQLNDFLVQEIEEAKNIGCWGGTPTCLIGKSTKLEALRDLQTKMTELCAESVPTE